MADWKVSRERIELHTHYNAHSLELVSAGNRQFVVQKGLYNNGDIAIVVPEKSILPDNLAEPFKSYLRTGNVLGSTKLRGELSEGVLLKDDPSLGALSEDISEKLGIEQRVLALPKHFAGNMKRATLPYLRHDCEPLGIFTNKIQGDVIVTEKIHGSQISVTIQNQTVEVTSKGLAKREAVLEQSDSNFYWQAVKNTDLHNLILDAYGNQLVQVIGEAVPCQKGFDYGFESPSILVYKVLVNGVVQSPFEVPKAIYQLWVPILSVGAFDMDVITKLSKGMSNLANKHIKEGVVVSNNGMNLKFISDAYSKKTSGDEFN